MKHVRITKHQQTPVKHPPGFTADIGFGLIGPPQGGISIPSRSMQSPVPDDGAGNIDPDSFGGDTQ